MARKKKIPGGIGATGSAKGSYFHPGKEIKKHWPNAAKERLQGVILGQQERRIRKQNVMAYKVRLFEYDGDQPNEFFIHPHNFKVETPCTDPSNVFADEAPPTLEGDNDALRESTSNVDPNVSDDIDELRAQGIAVDDDNEPAPENTGPPPADALPGTWCTPTICARRANPNITDSIGTFKEKSWNTIAEMDEFGLFRLTYPEKYLIDTVIPATNQHIKGPKLTISEFYKWLGCQFFMACYEGISDRTLWWSSKKVDMFDGAPFRLNEYMSSSRFEAITGALRLTDRPYPTDFLDRFHEVRQCIEAFNDHYSEKYDPSWLSCLDESMNVWLDKYCPGFMVVPRKPHPEGNEYHTICDGDEGRPILWRMELVEGKDRPKKGAAWAFPCEFEQEGITKTPALMLQMTKPIFSQLSTRSTDL